MGGAEWAVFTLNLDAHQKTPNTMSFLSWEAALEHACSLPPRVQLLYIENPEGQRTEAEDVERLCRIQSLLWQHRTQQFSQFEWSEIETFVTELVRTQPIYEELVSRVEGYVADVVSRRQGR